MMEIPVIGIGAGPATDGQVLVFHDLLGIRDGLGPRFVKRYANLQEEMNAGVPPTRRMSARGAIPVAEHTYKIDPARARGTARAGLSDPKSRCTTCRVRPLGAALHTAAGPYWLSSIVHRSTAWASVSASSASKCSML